MNASADGVVERAEQWGAEFDQPSADTLVRLEEVLESHVADPYMDETVCTCGVVLSRSFAAHVVQELAKAGLLVALADLNACTCTPCADPQYGAPGVAHCAACCMGTGVEEYDPACPDSEHREMAARQFGRPVPRPAVRTGSFAAPGGPKTLADEDVS